MARMSKLFPEDFNFFPKTYMIPSDYSELRNQFASVKERKSRITYIVKPDASSQGRGIYLTRNLDEIDSMANVIVQEYIQKVFELCNFLS